MKSLSALALFSFLFVGCASTSDSDGGSSPMADSGGKKTEELASKLKLAQARLEVKEMEQKAAQLQHDNQLRYAQADVAMAEAKLAKFREVDAPNRVASEELNLQTTKDRAQEAKDELAQIEIMYKDQDLDDLTAEFVVSRGRRSAERAQARIEIQEASFKSLRERELPQEEMQLELALEKAKNAMRKVELDGEISQRSKSIAIQEARDAMEKLERELEEANS